MLNRYISSRYRSNNVMVIHLGLRPIWSNSQLVEQLKQHKIWFSGLTDMPVVTSVVIMNRSRLVETDYYCCIYSANA